MARCTLLDVDGTLYAVDSFGFLRFDGPARHSVRTPFPSAHARDEDLASSLPEFETDQLVSPELTDEEFEEARRRYLKEHPDEGMPGRKYD